MRLASHPFWLVGFRPFFTFACLSGMLMPAAWALVWSGMLPAPSTHLTPVQWHAHEMFYGFGWAMLGGFLLTATKNWVSIRGYHGPILMFLAGAWVVERIAMSFGGNLPLPVFYILANAFLGSTILLILWTLIRYHKQDDYRDNGFFMVALPVFLVAKQLMLSSTWFDAGYGMTLALFRVAFLVMLERTLTQFMRNGFQVNILRSPLLDRTIKVLGVLLVIEPFMPTPAAVAASTLLAVLLLVRLPFWHPQRARRIELAVMFIGYLMIALQLLAQAVERMTGLAWVGTVSVHLFTFGVMGLIIPAMIVRIARGHTGRKVMFDPIDRAVVWLMLAAFAFRIVLPQVPAGSYVLWIQLSAACWFVCFGVLAWRYVPFLLQPRIDGKVH